MVISVASGKGGTGKTTVASFLAEMGAFVVDADELTRLVMSPGGSAYARVVQRFGPDILSSDGRYTCLAGFPVVYWGQDRKRGRLKFRCPAAVGKCRCLFQSGCSTSSYGRTFYLHPERDYRLAGPIPRGTPRWQEKYNARTSVERAYSEEKGSHRLASPRVRGLSRIKIHVYLALCGQVVKRIGAAITSGIIRPHRSPCLATT